MTVPKWSIDRFGGMRDGTKHRGGMRDGRNSIVGCWIKIFRQERDLPILRRDADSCEIDGGMRDENQKITGNERYAKNCLYNQVGSG